MKVLIEIPDNWFDFESPLGLASYTIKQRLDSLLLEALKEQYISKVKLPKIKISNKELKKAIIDKMAERALNNE